MSNFDHPSLVKNINQSVAVLRKAQPQAMAGFGQLAKAAMAAGSISEKHNSIQSGRPGSAPRPAMRQT